MSLAIDAAVAAVLVDSAVTAMVGRALLAAAHREATRAAETMRPALNDAIAEAIEQAAPLLLPVLVERLRPPRDDDGMARG